MKNQNKRKSKQAELELLASNDLVAIKAAIEEYAFNTGTQLFLLKNESMEHILNLYLSLRKPCKEFVTEILEGEYKEEIIKKAVIGNCLDDDNEILLAKFHPELLEEYLQNKDYPYLNEEAQEYLLENMEEDSLIRAALKKFPRPVAKPASQSMADLFSPEQRKKLGL